MKPHALRPSLLLSIILLLVLMVGHCAAWSNAKRPVVYVAQIEGTIDMGLVPYVKRVLQEAQNNRATAVVLQINTFGGQLDAAVQIRDALIKSPVNSIAFIDSRAISAGALISLAATSIVMMPGATIGAATPVLLDGNEAQTASEKTVSYVRKEFSATAQMRQRNPLVAEAMVDPDVVIPDVTIKGKLLTLTTSEALQLGIADSQASSLKQALEELGIRDATLIETETNWAESLLRFLTHPTISSLLVTVAMLGIIMEIRSPGLGFAGAIGLCALGLFMGGHWLVELAGWEELLLLLAGIVLLLAELFLIPGFGIAGILGIGCLLSAMVLSTLGPGASWQALGDAAMRFGFALLLALLASLFLLRLLPRTRYGRHLILQTGLDALSGFTSEPQSDHALLGQTGITTTPLRPAGLADIQGQRVDVVSDGQFVPTGTRIKVTQVDGNRIVVRCVDEAPPLTGEV